VLALVDVSLAEFCEWWLGASKVQGMRMRGFCFGARIGVCRRMSWDAGP
jgi:hypothetical protein